MDLNELNKIAQLFSVVRIGMVNTNLSLTKYCSNNVCSEFTFANEHLNTDDRNNSLNISEGKENEDNTNSSIRNSNNNGNRNGGRNVSNKNDNSRYKSRWLY